MPRPKMTEEQKQAKQAERQANEQVEVMNAYAKRVLEGQSPDLPPRFKVERIANALRKQGYEDLTGLTLPIKDFKKYL